MSNKRSRAVIIVEAIIALPLVYLLWLLTAEFIEMYGLAVIPVGVAVYFVISLLVDKFFWKQSTQLEQALERKLTFAGEKSGHIQKEVRD